MIHNTARLPLPALISPGAADDLRSGKQLVGADGSIVTGTLPEVIQATPTISVSSGGLITASATQSGGIVEGGTKSSTKQLTTQGAKTVTPGTTNQTAVASGRYTTGDVDVAGDANLKAENIAEGVSIFGVLGAHSGLGKEVTAHIGSGPSSMGPWYTSGKTDVIQISTPNQNYTVVVPSILVVLQQSWSADLNYSGGIRKINWGSGMPLQIYYVYDEFWLST